MIIGVSLVVDDLQKGQKLVYRYPEAPPASIVESKSPLMKYYNDYLCFAPDNFAKLFRPKADLFNKVLEMKQDITKLKRLFDSSTVP